MKILAIESTCDETAAAIVEDGVTLHSNVVASQIDIHAEYGGVVPEIAARSHLEVIQPVISKAMTDANLNWDDIDAIAVAYAPGLVGSLLVGTLAARTLAILHNKPLYPVHHVEGHVYANFITEDSRREIEDSIQPTSNRHILPTSFVLPTKQPEFPMLALAVSGLHSQLIIFRGHGDYELLGHTLDDAVGEAFDKVAKILGLPYPGGPSIAAAAEHGDPKRYVFPKAKLKGPYDFSFSGLKTAVLRSVQREVGKDFTFPSHELSALLVGSQRNDFAASFQRVAVETLVDKTLAAYRQYQPKSVVIAGGVAANQELRRELKARLPIAIDYAPMQLCTDNAAMIGALAYFQSKTVASTDPRNVSARPTLSMNDTKWSTATV